MGDNTFKEKYIHRRVRTHASVMFKSLRPGTCKKTNTAMLRTIFRFGSTTRDAPVSRVNWHKSRDAARRTQAHLLIPSYCSQCQHPQQAAAANRPPVRRPCLCSCTPVAEVGGGCRGGCSQTALWWWLSEGVPSWRAVCRVQSGAYICRKQLSQTETVT
jgi:hypothetical protein